MNLKLLTPGPLSTTLTTKQAMLRDWGTRDKDYYKLVQEIRSKLLKLANADKKDYTVVFLQGSGTYGVESVLNSCLSTEDKILILSNGAYGQRMAAICRKSGKNHDFKEYSMIEALAEEIIEPLIQKNEYTHIAVVHCETTAGVLNDIEMISRLTKKHKKKLIVDAMSSFGGIPIDLYRLQIDFLITSANKCLHGTPGVSIIFGKKDTLDSCKDNSYSLSLDLYDQYKAMEEEGSFRFTSPTHVMAALNSAIDELIASGGIETRYKDYKKKQKAIAGAMKKLGFEILVAPKDQAPIITTFLCPSRFDFNDFYNYMKNRGFLLYSGKLPTYDAFRIGNIGDISMEDIEALISAAQSYMTGGQKNGC